MADCKTWVFVFLGVALLYVLTPVLTPFFIAGVLAYLGDPLVNRLQRWHLPRSMGVAIVFLLAVLLIFGSIVLVVPVIQGQLLLLIQKTPVIIAWVQEHVMSFFSRFIDVEKIDFANVQATLSKQLPKLGAYTERVMAVISHSGFAFIGAVIDVFITVVVAFYLMRDWPALKEKFDRSLPRAYQQTVKGLLQECDDVLSAFFFGQLLVMLTLAFFYSCGLSILGLDVAIMVGVIAGLVSVVPYFGTVVGVCLAMVAALIQFHTGLAVMWVAIIFAVGHILESMVLTPWLVGDRIGLHPVAVIFAVLAGGMLLGFVGILIALPVAAVMRVVMYYFYKRYLSSNFYRGQRL